MKIILDFGGYEFKNVGDTAMLILSIDRLTRLFPNIEVYVFTSNTEKLKILIPNAIPLDVELRTLYTMRWSILGGLHKLTSKNYHPLLEKLEDHIKISFPNFSKNWMNFRLRKKNYKLSKINDYLNLIKKSDIVIATGGGYITDPFESHAKSVLQMLALAKTFNKPIALLGQGIGPITSVNLSYWCQHIFPKFDLLTLREQKNSLPLSLKMGCHKERICVTGDDAIELAYNLKNTQLGQSIGINLRVASYSGVNDVKMKSLKSLFEQIKNQYRTHLLPVPISYHEGDSDAKSLEILLDKTVEALSIEETIKQIGHCRIVITGSYHAGVFALSQGISVIGLVSSDYYQDKFDGLADQFSHGCFVVNMASHNFPETLLKTVHVAWDMAGGNYEKLLIRAKYQIDQGNIAYTELTKLVK